MAVGLAAGDRYGRPAGWEERTVGSASVPLPAAPCGEGHCRFQQAATGAGVRVEVCETTRVRGRALPLSRGREQNCLGIQLKNKIISQLIN
jgi:hypothetical protein